MVNQIIKFNNGCGAILCNNCRIIIKEGVFEHIDNTELLFCEKCLLNMKNDYKWKKNTF